MSVKGFKLSDGTVEKYDYSSLEDIVTDDTLALSGVAADAKKVGDELTGVKQDLAELQEEIEGGSKWNNNTVRQFIAILQSALYSSDMSDAIIALETALISDEPIAVTGVTLDQSIVSGFVADTVTLTATVLPLSADDRQVTWSSSNNSVATVSDGVITFVGTGSATITVTTHDGGYTASCSVTVSAYPTISYFIGANMTVGSDRPGKVWARDYYNIRATAFLTEQYRDAPQYEIDSTLTSKGFPVPAYGLFIPTGATKVTVSCSGLCCAIVPYAVEDGYATLIDNGHWSEVGGETNYNLSTFVSQGANCISLGFKNSSNSSLADTTIDSTTVQVSFS